MERYRVLCQLGDGSYGTVWKAVNRQTNEVVAVKRMKRKFPSWEECMALREVKSLRRLCHPCIVKLKEVVRESNELFFIFEHLDCNLYQAMKQQQGKLFPERQVQIWTYQILRGLEYMHSSGYFHRDMKPENLLVRGDKIMKIADFGLARESNSQPPYTEYVSTRWYRAPEVLLRKPDYGPAVDLFAVGAMMAEMLTLKPLFPGATELDELSRMCGVLGPFTADSWPEGHKLLSKLGFSLQAVEQQPLSQQALHASAEALDLMTSLCCWDPAKRPTASQALRHSFFKDVEKVLAPEPVSLTLDTAAANPIALPPPAKTDTSLSNLIEVTFLKPAASLSACRSNAGGRAGIQDIKPKIMASRRKRSSKLAMGPSLLTIHKKNGVQDGEAFVRRRAMQMGQPPPDLWVNAKGIALAKQQAGFSQLARGSVNQQGRWTRTPCSPGGVAIKPAFAAKGVNLGIQSGPSHHFATEHMKLKVLAKHVGGKHNR